MCEHRTFRIGELLVMRFSVMACNEDDDAYVTIPYSQEGVGDDQASGGSVAQNPQHCCRSIID